MTRTWSLAATISAGFVVQNIITGGDTLYFIDSTAQAVISWDGVTETDISGSTWTGDAVVRDLCYFNSTIYAAVDTYDGGGGYGCAIYSYDGTGQSWTLESYLEGLAGPCLFETGNNENKWLVNDDDRMVAAASDGTYTLLFISSDGTNWNISTINDGYDYTPNIYLLGTSFTSLTTATLIAQDGAVRRAIQYNPTGGEEGGGDWEFVGADIETGGPVLVGYADDKSFFADYITETLEYSSDWGVSRSGTSLPATGAGQSEGVPRVWHLSDDVIMSSSKHLSSTAYTWNGSDDFMADGTTGSDVIYTYFTIGGILYAMTDNSRIYGGGSLSGGGGSDEFYYGVEALDYMVDLSFGVKPKGMTINPDTNDVVVVSDTAQTIMAERMLKDENYGIANDFSDGLEVDAAIVAVEYI